VASGVRVRGTKEVMRNMGRVQKGVPRDLERGLVRVAESIIGDAKDMTPVDTGALRASGHVRKPKRDVRGMKVELGFGGPAVDYAIPVHERTDVRHKVGKGRPQAQPDDGRPTEAWIR
jgi:hypothetical protein